jgi:hypothetical protein
MSRKAGELPAVERDAEEVPMSSATKLSPTTAKLNHGSGPLKPGPQPPGEQVTSLPEDAEQRRQQGDRRDDRGPVAEAPPGDGRH